MVLNASPSKGFSLFELIIAMSLAALLGGMIFAFQHQFSQLLFQTILGIGAREREIAWVGSLERGLMEGKGIKEVSNENMVVVSRSGKELRLEKKVDGSVVWNGKKLSVFEFKIRIEGPDCSPPLSETDVDCRAMLDSLDQDGDGVFALEDLDRDRDGFLRNRELRYLRMVELSWRSHDQGILRTLALHPRLKFRDNEENAAF